MDDLVWNHISTRTSEDSYLITPGNRLWSQIEPEHLVFSSENVTADVIHSAIYCARLDVCAIIHLHTPNAVAVSCLADGFQALTQDSAFFYKKVAVHEWEGLSNNTEESERIGNAVHSIPFANTLLMRNHGFCCFGRDVAEAWVLAYNFEKACATQMQVLSSGARIRLPDPSTMARAAEQAFLPGFYPGEAEWPAITALIESMEPAYTSAATQSPHAQMGPWRNSR